MIEKNFKKALLAGVGTILFDGIFHHFFTTPQEPFYYYMAKYIFAISLAYFYFAHKGFKSLDPLKRKLVFAGFFIFYFTIYYRLWEFANTVPFGHAVPSIVYQGKTYVWENFQTLHLIFWTLVHGGAFFVPVYLIERYW